MLCLISLHKETEVLVFKICFDKSLKIPKMTPSLCLSSQITKQKVVTMETQYKLAAHSAQLLAKEAPPDEAAKVMATMTTAKSQLSKAGIIYI